MAEDKKRLLFIRTYRSVGLGGPVPPLELLYMASSIERNFDGAFDIRIIDTGINNLSLEESYSRIKYFSPDFVLMNSQVWEAGFLHRVAALIKKIDKKITTIVQGQLATLAGEKVMFDENIDFVITGEGDLTLPVLIENVIKDEDLSAVEGIIWRKGPDIATNKKRIFIEDLNSFQISPSAWDLVNLKDYAKYSNWNGALKEDFYAPVLTSRGCPFECVFCCNRELLGKKFRTRSDENVVNEIRWLVENKGVKEIHIFDAVFNYDMERAKRICRALINSGLKISIAFPHGMRADRMDGELIRLLKAAGTYKLVYGVESGSENFQRKIRKNLVLDNVKEVIKKTSKSGMIVGGYFIMGFPGETETDVEKTIDFAVNSYLDIASFFKLTLYEEVTDRYRDILDSIKSKELSDYSFEDFSYYSKKRSYAEMDAAKLNYFILKAQRKFYMNPKRIFRSFLRFQNKILFIKNMLIALSLIIQSFLLKEIGSAEVTSGDS
ncbi:MAG: radical SAM protein [Candidatus Omnitrophica bacterium]|nr:radical SAM protein [Candidatus Omnitrophota bacterium]MBD3269710.1 radical SAM protein [Candidatus Omnitrophota bacterium]